ncbi:39S ribosomal protein S18a, mitochondrial-like [Gigantopelta aegis]|uniref:39S ribosomal protein S18a, mitochondrial-like n=1 Tax=Gigantopelta aegis TaxID=1735272 RepID=UPI001B88C725|nr:39S ribosomal protein S18a, mitochondrial-like [Gigantopelta aegis]
MSHLITNIVLSAFRQSRRCCQPALCIAQNKQLFYTSSKCSLKEIHETQAENTIIVEGIKVKSEKEDRVLHVHNADACPLCRLNLDLKYTDVLLLSQFLRADGCVLPRRVTGICAKQQTKVQALVQKAQRAGLMPNYKPDLKDGKERKTLKSQYKWKKYNVYFEED